MVKTHTNFLLQSQESFEADSWCIHQGLSLPICSMMVIGLPLTFLWQGQIEKSFSQYVLKTNG